VGDLVPLPRVGDIFADERGEDRTMRVSRHDEHDVVVVSLWVGKQCRASFRLPLDDVERLTEALGAAAPEPPRSVLARWLARLAS
jgi:hypothetical protein